MSRSSLTALIASVVGVGLVGILGWQVMENRELQRKLSMNPESSSAVRPSESAASQNAPTLAAAFALLPDPSQAVGGREISPGKFWVWVKVVKPNDQVAEVAWQSVDQSWFVDVGRRETRMLSSHDFLVPYGPTVSHAGGSDRYFYVHWTAGWEGPPTSVEEYIDRDTGVLAYSLTSKGGTELVVAAPTRTLTIELSPVDACEDNAMPPAKTVMATGLDINGTHYAFPKPRQVQCIPSEFLGQGFYPAFEYFVFSEGENVIRIGLPWSPGTVEIPATNLDPSKIEFR